MSVANAPGRRLVSAIYPEHYPFDQLTFVSEFAVTINPDYLTDEDILLVWGGEDISPELYGEPVNRYGDGSPLPSRRDQIEWDLMQRAKQIGIPIIGVCRGAQMMCALMGGSLWQDVDNHCGNHMVYTVDGKQFETNSLHHQMLRLDNIPADQYEVIAWTEARSKVYHHGLNLVRVKKPGDTDPEFVYFPTIRGFAVQWHPEFVEYPNEATDYVFNFINSKLEVLVNE